MNLKNEEIKIGKNTISKAILSLQSSPVVAVSHQDTLSPCPEPCSLGVQAFSKCARAHFSYFLKDQLLSRLVHNI